MTQAPLPPEPSQSSFFLGLKEALAVPKNWVWLVAPFAGVLFLAILYTFYWNSVAAQAQSEIETWFEEQRQAGLTAEYGELIVTGYPYRLQAELTDVQFGDPNTAAEWHWETPKALLNALPYNLNHVILRLPEPVIYQFTPARASGLRSNETRAYRLESDTLRASVRLSGGQLKRFSAEAKDVSVTGERQFTDGDTAALAAFSLNNSQVHVSPTFAEDNGNGELYFAFKLEGFDWPSANINDGPLPTQIDKFALMGKFDNAPLTDEVLASSDAVMQLLNEWANAGGSLELAEFAVEWGDLSIDSSGDLRISDEGTPEGAINARIAGVEGLLAAMEDSGQLQPKQAAAYRQMFVMLSQSQGDQGQPGSVEVPITMREGGLFLGPAQIANLPVLFAPRP